MESFFSTIEDHYSKELPFVVYRKPNESSVIGLFQNNDDLCLVTNYKESGFVFAPFNSNKQTVLIPLEHSHRLEADYTTLNEEVEEQLDYISKSNKASHIDLVKNGIHTIKRSQLKKVVLSRVESFDGEFNPLSSLKILLKRYPSAFVYWFYHPKIGLWLGATPERLLLLKGQTLSTMSLAATQPYKGSLDVSWTTKEQDEQQFVTDYIKATLEPLCKSITVSEPKTTRAGSLLHLKTDISVRFSERIIDLKSIIESLHPTPAICGLPKDVAKDFILNHESYDRAYYTGFLGELNFMKSTSRNTNRRNVENNAYRSLQKTSELYVNLRCMQLLESKALIYVGGGITKDSDPEEEWLETQRKTQTMINAL